MLQVRNLHVSVEGKPILKGVTLAVRPGQIAVLMGPNGSGKSTLAQTLMGHPRYTIERGDIRLGRRDLTKLSADQRARAGLFLAWQYPLEIPGVDLVNMLRTAYQEIHGRLAVPEFMNLLKNGMKKMGIPFELATRSVNESFSGGEKKRAEILQLAVLRPKIAILDETDSGLDIDALKIVAANVRRLTKEGLGVLVITHYQRWLNYLTPDVVFIMQKGRLTHAGGAELVRTLETGGYRALSSRKIYATPRRR